MISVLQLGTVDYTTGLRLQKTLVDLRKAERIANTLLLLEHTPVITLGRNAERKNIVAPAALLRSKGVEVFECDRGGDVTFHGPGQLVGYPIFDLRSFFSENGERRTVGAVEYVRRVEEALIRTCADFGIATTRVPKMTGVWTEKDPHLPSPGRSGAHSDLRFNEASSRGGIRSDGEQAKIAAIGVHISRGITSHGFALNVNTALDYFKLIVPCGIASKPVTSMANELGHNLLLDEVAQSVARNFGRTFNSQVLWVEELNALLGNSVGVPARAPQDVRRIHEEEIFWA
jgi:lipoyl(octanoyl) transferase